jgi:ribosomal protein L19E
MGIPIVTRDMGVGAGVPFVDVDAIQDAVEFVTPLTHQPLLDCVSKRKESERASERERKERDEERERERERGSGRESGHEREESPCVRWIRRSLTHLTLTRTHVCMYVHVYIYIYVCMSVCLYVCMYVCT